MDSLRHIDKSCIFRETFQDSQSVANNRYTKGTINATGVKVENGEGSFIKAGGYIQYNFVKSLPTYTIRVKCKFNNIDSSTNQHIFDISNQSINVYKRASDNQLQLPVNVLFFVNGIQRNSLMPSKDIVYDLVFVRTVSTALYLKNIRLGNWSTATTIYGMQGSIELFEVYNRTLSASEVKLLYQGQLYKEPKLPLLLNFDSTRGIIEDRTGRNTLTATNVEVKKIGKVYGAYFNGNSSKIDFLFTQPSQFSLNAWVKAFSAGETGTGSIVQSTHFLFRINSVYQIVADNDASNRIASTSQNIKKFRNILLIRNSNGNISIYIDGNKIIDRVFGGVPVTTSTTFTLGNNISQIYTWNGFIPKLQIFQGIPDRPDEFAANLYNSQKHLYV